MAVGPAHGRVPVPPYIGSSQEERNILRSQASRNSRERPDLGRCPSVPKWLERAPPWFSESSVRRPPSALHCPGLLLTPGPPAVRNQANRYEVGTLHRQAIQREFAGASHAILARGTHSLVRRFANPRTCGGPRGRSSQAGSCLSGGETHVPDRPARAILDRRRARRALRPRRLGRSGRADLLSASGDLPRAGYRRQVMDRPGLPARPSPRRASSASTDRYPATRSGSLRSRSWIRSACPNASQVKESNHQGSGNLLIIAPNTLMAPICAVNGDNGSRRVQLFVSKSFRTPLLRVTFVEAIAPLAFAVVFWPVLSPKGALPPVARKRAAQMVAILA